MCASLKHSKDIAYLNLGHRGHWQHSRRDGKVRNLSHIFRAHTHTHPHNQQSTNRHELQFAAEHPLGSIMVECHNSIYISTHPI